MQKKLNFKFICFLFFLFFSLCFASLSYAKRVILFKVPNYKWWYGCAPTAVGMLLGYYDIFGYAGLRYDNLIPNGRAKFNTFPSKQGEWQYNVQYIIASPEHVEDFYRNRFGAKGDDAPPPYHEFNSLADFMGTSQDSVGNRNGFTSFFFSSSPIYVSTIYRLGYQKGSGLYGIWKYIDSCGYGTHDPAHDKTMFNQYVDTYVSGGFSFNDFMSEINSGRPVIIHLKGHVMLGYGYNTDGQVVYVRDTWSPRIHTMTWGGEYHGRKQIGVTCIHITGGTPVPIPASVLLILFCLLLIFLFKKKFYHKLF